jgi:hypothetical protein
MRLLAVVAFLAASLTAVSAATADTTQYVTVTFTEPVHPASTSCPNFPDSSCGSGEVIPLGHATDTVIFGAGCGGTCDQRTVYLAGGTLVMDETFSDPACHYTCKPGPLEVVSGNLTSVVVDGTGVYEGASGTLTGTAHFSISNARPAGVSIVHLSGIIHYDP